MMKSIIKEQKKKIHNLFESIQLTNHNMESLGAEIKNKATNVHSALTTLECYSNMLERSSDLTHYKPKRFSIEELVPRYHAENFDKNMLWSRFDPRILWTIDHIAMLYDQICYINTYKFDISGSINLINGINLSSDLQYRGWRHGTCTIGSDFSLHKFAAAVDFNLCNTTPYEFVKDVKDEPNTPEFKYITGVEYFEGISWNHIDCRNFDKSINNNLPLLFNNRGQILDWSGIHA